MKEYKCSRLVIGSVNIEEGAALDENALISSNELCPTSLRKVEVFTYRHDDAVASRIDDLRAQLGVV
jgi:hypothetical protein